MSCKMSKNEEKWFVITGTQYLLGLGLMVLAAINREYDGTIVGWWAIAFIIGVVLMAGGYLSEFVMRYYNEKEGDRVYSKWGI